MLELRLKDLVLHYEVSGSGTPLMLIHGLGSCGLDWEAQVHEFAKNYQVIVPDLRGHGASSAPEGPYSIALFAADLRGMLDQLGGRAAHVVGWSLGGAIAFQLALDAPELVRSITIVNSGPELLLRTWQEKFAIWSRIAMVRFLGLPRFGAVLAKRLFPKQEQGDLRTTFIERYIRNRKKPYLASLRALVGWSVTARLGEIRCPVLVISGDQDYTAVAAKEAYVAQLADARLVVIADSHHATPIDQPQAFNQALRDFLAP